MYRTSFFPQAIRLWNQLPGSVVEAVTLDSFKAQLSKAFMTVYMLLTCTVHRRHHHSKVREYFIGYALYPEEEKEAIPAPFNQVNLISL